MEVYKVADSKTAGKPSAIVMDKQKSLSVAAKRLLNKRKMKCVKTVMARKRARHQVQMDEPLYFDELSAADFEKFIDSNEEQIFNELITEPSKMIAFSTPTNYDILSKCQIWSWDSTFKVGCFYLKHKNFHHLIFKVVPMRSEFAQFLVIMGFFNGSFVPLAFVLMSKNGKKMKDYLRVLEFLPLTNRVKVIITDFEGAALKALRKVIHDNGYKLRVSFFKVTFKVN